MATNFFTKKGLELYAPTASEVPVVTSLRGAHELSDWATTSYVPTNAPTSEKTGGPGPATGRR